MITFKQKKLITELNDKIEAIGARVLVGVEYWLHCAEDSELVALDSLPECMDTEQLHVLASEIADNDVNYTHDDDIIEEYKANRFDFEHSFSNNCCEVMHHNSVMDSIRMAYYFNIYDDETKGICKAVEAFGAFIVAMRLTR